MPGRTSGVAGPGAPGSPGLCYRVVTRMFRNATGPWLPGNMSGLVGIDCPLCRFLVSLARRGLLGRSLGPLLGRQRIPDAHREVAGAGDEPGAVGAPGDGVDVVGVAAALRDLLSP